MEINSIGIFLFDGVELLDFAGPLEVFGAANYLKDDGLFSINTVAEKKQIKTSKGLLHVSADHILSDQTYDLFIIPGGYGTRSIVRNPELLHRIDGTISHAKITASVCTGALILAALGRLSGKTVCSHHLSFDKLLAIDPTVTIMKEERYTDHGEIITSAGVSAGIDMGFHFLSRYYSKAFSDETRQYIEYYPAPVL